MTLSEYTAVRSGLQPFSFSTLTLSLFQYEFEKRICIESAKLLYE